MSEVQYMYAIISNSDNIDTGGKNKMQMWRREEKQIETVLWLISYPQLRKKKEK